MAEEVKAAEVLLGEDGLPSAEQTEAWKKVHGEVSRMEIAGQYYYYRPLTRGEHKDIREKLTPQPQVGPDGMPIGPLPTVDEDILDEEIVHTTVLWPKINPSTLKAGIVPNLSGEVMRISGYVPDAPPEKL